MIILDAVSGMDDVHFNMKDVIYIVTLVISVLGGWFSMKAAIEKLKHRLETVDTHVSSCQQDAKEDSITAKHSRTGIRKQFQDEMRVQAELSNKRIDIVKQDLKDSQKDNASEFKSLNDQMTAVKTDTSEIKGMVQMLISKGGK
tara:strand:- start:3762 stop:4193 length:432 start_codon:yes stop_codon:yes gene_type:complete